MKFYGYFRSSAAYRVRIAFNLLGISPEYAYIHLTKDGGQQKTPEFSALNPQQLIPALEIGGQINDQIITQSLPIIEYLNETQNGNLLDADPLKRAHIRAFAAAIACDIHPLQNLRVLKHIAKTYGLDQDGKDAWCQRWLGEGLAACEALAQKYAAQKHSTGKFVFGDHPTIADICLVPQIFSAHRFHVDLSDMPRLRAIFDHCQTLDAFREASPANQPDAE